ncbi:MFS transporter [Trujillonella endophytica]|uniref:Major Facilitator Superfamily protein n=1 Tax=Trujillonella endophytica TaxID=673521 RepID=A0A1H8SF97_9ACTN|nr:MFS transporter [Trujillella endophytica]SEO77227.1 Major Facilitator Superfamily protein [Trujillella endophytica]
MTTKTLAPPTGTVEPPARTWPWLLFVGIGALVVSLASSLLIPVLATLPAELDTSADTVQWLLTSTLLVSAVAVPLFGRLGDMFGTRRMLLVALGTLVVGSLVTATSTNVAVLIAGRAIQGLSSAAVPLGIGLLSALLPRERAGGAIALISAMLGVGGALGLPFAGIIAEHFDFHALFWITGAAAVVAFVGILVVVPESPVRTGGRVDLVGGGLLAATLVSLLLPLAEGSDWGWGSARTIGLLALAVVLLGVFGWSQTRIAQPLVDLATLRRGPMVLTNVATLFFGFALFASLIGTASYVQAPESSGYGFGSSIIVGGLAMLPGGLCMLVFAPISARLIARRGPSRVLALGGVIVALGWVARIVFTGSLTQVILGATVVGIGTSIGYAAMPSLINRFTPRGEIAAANGLNMLIRSVGSSLASAIGGSLLAAITISVGAYAVPSLTAYRILFVICAVAALLAATAALFIPDGTDED